MAAIWAINPSRRKSRRHRSAAQRAATRKMLAANRARFHHNPRKRKSRRKARRSAAPAAEHTVRRRRRRSASGKRRVSRRSYRRAGRMFGGSEITRLLKDGALGGAGAVVVDIGMGQVNRFLPASMQTPVDASGNVQWGYFGAKAALALALGIYGKRIMPAAYAEKMGEGALTVMAYQMIRPMVPAALTLGYLNPAPTMRPRAVAGTGAYLKGAGAYPSLPVRATSGDNRGARASQVVSLVGRG